MSERRDDDLDLRAMLEARADRVGASAPREVMAAVRDEMRAPREGAAFAVMPLIAVVPLLTGRRRAGGLGWVAAALVAVVVLAVVGRGSFTSPSTATDAATAGSSASPATAPSGATAVSIAGLRRALADRSLDGRLLTIDTDLRESQPLISCVSNPCPRSWALDMVGPVVTAAQDGQPVVPGVPGPDVTLAGATWVVVPHDGQLFLVGAAREPIGRPQTWSALVAAAGPEGMLAGSATLLAGLWLEPVAGWLAPGTGGATDRAIAERRPGSEPAGPQTSFPLASPAPGIDPAATVPTEGPFLVRLGAGPKPEVVARYDPASLVRVTMPPITCAPPPSDAAMLTCDDAIGVALGADQGASPITSIEFAYGWYCGNGTFCPLTTAFNGHVIIRHEVASQDLVVVVRARADGGLEMVDSGPLVPPASASPGPSVAGLPATPLDAGGLRTALASGSLDGTIVLVDGTLAERSAPCTSPSTPDPCFELYLPALDGVKVWEGRGPGAASPAALPAGSLVFVAVGGALTFLGTWATSSANPITVAAMLGQASPPAYDALAFVSGWLVSGGVNTCHPLAPGATPCPPNPPWLTGDEPNQDGLLVSDHGVTVGLDPSGFAGTLPAIVTPGPFLVRHASDTPCDHGTQSGDVSCMRTPTGWEVVVPLDGRPIVRAILPGH